VTAGGDAPGEAPPPAAVEVVEVAVPEVLDRMPPQARRILEDVGLVVVEAPAVNGPPGRVVDQLPMPGTVVRKGSVVTIRVAPGAPRSAPAPTATPGDPGPSGEAAPSGAVSVPSPISPPAGTSLPAERVLPLGFAWRAVAGADGYVLEIEERGADGWLPSARLTVRSTAATVEVERLGALSAALRWRVRAVAKGRPGAPCAWVELR
jgi:hypothetical protein